MLVKTLAKNLSIFSNWQTILVTFLLEPFFTVLFYTLLTNQRILGDGLWPYLSLMMMIQSIVVMAQLLVKARDNGLLKEVFGTVFALRLFLLTAIQITFLIAAGQGVVLYLLFSLTGQFIGLSFSLLCWLVLSLCFAILFGLLVSLPFLRGENPFFGSNLLVACLPIVSATLAPISHYPDWLAWLSRLLPFWLLQAGLEGSTAEMAWLGLYGLLLLALLFVLLKKQLNRD
ncbi:hypothetical protein [Fructobacillus papyrifericola]|uniref:Uncharacterized protein n=1 Tax=Fructobacillus papyrifericola TaxID=2713172 RepID=A0ABS5QRD5_9LACO|nr:hypothetical protein [Fructobacillus papyrifericola]MBS9335685.1 hypothetical protein [Fructobacillus papyrifericola]